MLIEARIYRSSHTHYIDFSPAIDIAWAFPSYEQRGRCVLIPRGGVDRYADPPSHELRTLIEVGAPWYVVIDKLIEEYPQWQSHFEAAAAAERQRMEVA